MLRLYLDEDSMDSALVHALQARGVDVLTAHEAGMVGRPDADHLAFAAEQQRTLCSYNIADFYQLHSRHVAEGENHFGIILMALQRFGVGEQMRRLCGWHRLSPTSQCSSGGKRTIQITQGEDAG